MSNEVRGGLVHRELGRARAVFRRHGATQGLQKAIKYPMERSAATIGYLRHRYRYPSNVIFLASFAKSGSTWLANMLGELPGFSKYQPSGWTASLLSEPNHDIYPDLFAETKRRLAVIKGHTRGSIENTRALAASGRRYLITVRDPRDQMISGYWFLRTKPRHPAHGLAMEYGLDEFLRRELDPETAVLRRADWLRGWIENRDPEQSLIIRYEDLLADPAGQVAAGLKFLGFEVATDQVARMVERNTFERTSGRSSGVEDRTSFFRKGVSGEWREVFSPDHREQAAAVFEDVIDALGYEPST